MGWSIGYDDNWKRDIGYGVPAFCDEPGCGAEIDRGLAYVCGGDPYGGENGCGLYFCDKHAIHPDEEHPCEKHLNYTAKPDHPSWIKHKLTHASWKQWRTENPAEAEGLKALVGEQVGGLFE